ncbi:MAG: 16S rRNA (cytosine(1402)-N(4))-methyltransferase RsmH [Desulfobaccales bacterium]
MDQNPVHQPVMVREVLAGLVVRPDRLYVDGTVGEGGHAVAILARIAGVGELWGFDRDPTVLQTAAARLTPFTSHFRLFHRSYAQLGEVLEEAGRKTAAGILLDLGVSSFTLEASGRGFSFQRDEPLDMRFDPESPSPTAAQLLNRLPLTKLVRIFREYGEEPQARRLARRLCEVRQQRPLRTTGELADLVRQTLGSKAGKSRLHPATRVFQALRIAVNRELEELEKFLAGAPAWLEPGGRLVIIAYHSLEDRLVKHRFLAWERKGTMRRLTKKPLTPSPEEVRQNPRARSAKMRLAEKC